MSLGGSLKRVSYIKDKLLLSDEELDEVLSRKSSKSVFSIYMTAINFDDYGHNIFIEYGMNMHTTLPNNREVDDCKCLYDVILRNPFNLLEDGNLFSFFRNSLILSRDLKEGELL